MRILFRFFFFFSFFSFFIYAECNMYELDKNEKFHILKIANDNFLSVHSESLDMDFLLQCPKNTKIYAKILQSQKANKDVLKIKTSLNIENIKLSYPKIQAQINEIRFFMDKKQLSTIITHNDIFINKNRNKNIDYQVSKKNTHKSPLPLGFQCTKEYFFDRFQIKALSFIDPYEKEIVKNINRWNINNNDKNNEKIISWFINCKNWLNATKNKDLEDLYSIDRQILFQSSNVYKQTESILSELLQSSTYNEKVPESKVSKFVSVMDVLKNLEKNKLHYKIFDNINEIFYIRNNKNLQNSINYILSYDNYSYYYDLLSNTKIGSFIDPSKFKMEILISELNVYSFDINKKFLVFHAKSSININNQNTQFLTYKLSNSFCSYLNSKIQKANKTLKNKIDLVVYCNTKEFSQAYIYEKNNNSNKKISKKVNVQGVKLIDVQDKKVGKVKKGKCINIDNGKICTDISKNQIKKHIKNGLKIPSLDELIDNFDDEYYYGRTIYGINNKYFFLDEDEDGWITLNKIDKDTSVDLLLIKANK